MCTMSIQYRMRKQNIGFIQQNVWEQNKAFVWRKLFLDNLLRLSCSLNTAQLHSNRLYCKFWHNGIRDACSTVDIFIHFQPHASTLRSKINLYLTEFVFRQFTLAPFLSWCSAISLVFVESFKILAKLWLKVMQHNSLPFLLWTFIFKKFVKKS